MGTHGVQNTSWKKLATTYSKLQKTLRQLYSTILPKRNLLLLLVFVLLYGSVFSYLTLVKYYTFNATAWDLGVFSQSFYTTLNNGAFFYNNLEMGTHFHVHFSPVIILLLPLYAVYQSPETLLVLQAFVIALGAVPLYGLVKQELESEMWGLSFSALYLLYPGLHAANLYDFHPEALAPLFVFSALYFFKKGKWKTYFTFIMLSLTVKEDITLIGLGIGLYGLASNVSAFTQKRVNKAIVVSFLTIFVSIAWLFFAFYAVSYFVRLDGYPSLWNGGYSHHTENVYGNLGSGGLFGVISSLLSNPIKIVNQLQYLPHEKLVYIATLFLPLCMMSFLNLPSILLFLPTLSEYMLASNPNYFAIIYHYPAQLTPVIFVATVQGFKELCAKCSHVSTKTITARLLSLMLIATLITLFFTTPIVTKNVPLTISEEHQARLTLLSLIPLSADPHILTQNDYFPHVSNSRYAYAYLNTTNVDYILIDVASIWYNYQDPPPDEYVAKYGEPKLSFAERTAQYLNDSEFGLLGQANSLLLYKKDYKGDLSYYAPYKASFDWQKLLTYATTTEDPTALSEKIFLHKETEQGEEFFWYGPYITLPPGKYEVKFRLKIANVTDEYIVTLDVAEKFGNNILVESILTGANFSDADVWQDFTLEFELAKLTLFVEFRGVRVSNATDVYLDYVNVTQTAPISLSYPLETGG